MDGVQETDSDDGRVRARNRREVAEAAQVAPEAAFKRASSGAERRVHVAPRLFCGPVTARPDFPLHKRLKLSLAIVMTHTVQALGTIEKYGLQPAS